MLLLLYVLITSATGFIGLLICLIIIAVRNKIYNIFLGLIPSLAILIILYNNVSDFKIRVDAGLELNKSFENDIQRDIANTSTFTLYDNYIVTYNNFLENPIIGSGIGSHQYAFDKFSLTKKYSNLNIFANNSKDANSLFLRIVSETGLLGVFFLFYILYKGISTMNKLNKNEYIVSVSLLLIIILSLIRQGNYFLNGLPLIFILFYYNKNRFITKSSI
jgi:O-antigen ligase